MNIHLNNGLLTISYHPNIPILRKGFVITKTQPLHATYTLSMRW